MATEPRFKDPLTGAYSRSTLQQRLGEEVERAKCYQLAFSLLILDHFKSANDAFGHARGDQVLIECVACICTLRTRTLHGD